MSNATSCIEPQVKATVKLMTQWLRVKRRRHATSTPGLPSPLFFRASLLGLFLALSSAPHSRAQAGPQSGPQSIGYPSIAPRPGYVGDAVCMGCHKEKSISFQQTSHHLTSQIATRQSILGLQHAASNRLVISDPAKDPSQPGISFSISQKGEKFYETAVTGWPPDLQTRSEPIDLVTGSGTRGQTYLYWQEDRLFELPVSYWTEGHRWINSPGYENGSADFSRPINPGCLECHATYIRALSDDLSTNQFDRKSLIPGISCETCHGPGSAHVAKQQPGTTQLHDTYILNPANFSRDRQIDSCALCHGGLQRQEIEPAFSYIPGAPLSRVFKPLPGPIAQHPDVHGNQVGLLEQSKCFLGSPQMSCSTCHDVHAPEHPAESYSAKCLTCHQWQSCGVAKRLGHSIASNCIDCHMPVQPTKVIVSETAGKEARAEMRTHWIKIYPGAHFPGPAR